MAILTETMAAGFSGQLTAVAIKDVVTPALLALVWTRPESPALRELLVHSRQAFAPSAARVGAVSARWPGGAGAGG